MGVLLHYNRLMAFFQDKLGKLTTENNANLLLINQTIPAVRGNTTLMTFYCI